MERGQSSKACRQRDRRTVGARIIGCRERLSELKGVVSYIWRRGAWAPSDLSPLSQDGFLMELAQLYSELQDSGQRLFGALAKEREANIFNLGDSSYRKWLRGLKTARREVHRAAESYAIALKSYRAMLSELTPSEPVQFCKPARIARQRERLRAVSAPSGSRGSHCNRQAHKKVGAAEGFPVSTRRSKFQ
jgi:hypothetical protein